MSRSCSAGKAIPEVPVRGTANPAPVPFDWRRGSTRRVAGYGVDCRLSWRTPAGQRIHVLARCGQRSEPSQTPVPNGTFRAAMMMQCLVGPKKH